MKIWEAILYAVFGGATELLPLSFSGHAAVLHEVFHLTGLTETGGYYTRLGITLGVIAAIILSFPGESRRFGREVLCVTGARRRSRSDLTERSLTRSVLIGLFALLPMLLSLIFVALAERKTGLVVTALLFTVNGFVLYSACRYPEGRKNGERILVSDAAVVGVSRLAAIFPGLSSLGNSLAFGKFRGFEHEYNLRFAYLLTLSFQTVSVLYHLIRAVAFDSIAAGILPMLVSMVTAAAVGYFAIQLMRYLFEQGRVYVFSYYCWDATALILILALIRA